MRRFILAALIVGAAPGVVRAQLSYYTPQGARTHALGTTGSADTTDASNVALNPAIIAARHGMAAGGLYGSHTFSASAVDFTAKTGFVTGGYHFQVGDDVWLGAGAALTYARVELDSTSSHRTHATTAYLFSGSAGVGDAAYVSLGLGFKPMTFEQRQINPGEHTTTTYDIGVLLAGRLARFDGHTVRAALAFARINGGGTFDDDIRYLTGRSRMFTWERAALNVQFASRSWEKTDDAFGRTLPVVSAAANFDWEQEIEHGSGKRRYNTGLEVGCLQTVFVGLGYIHDESAGGPKTASFGFGLAGNLRRFRARFDYARAPYNNDNKIDYFSLNASFDL